MIIHDKEKVRNITSMTIEWMKKVVSGEIEHPLKQVIPGIIRSYEKGNDPICRGAPHLAIAHANEMMGTAKVDSLIAMSWFDIVAPSFGLGTCWAGFVSIAANEYKPLLDELELPEGHSFQYAIMFGHPVYKVNSIPGRDPAKLTWK
jgi:nitroreductase